MTKREVAVIAGREHRAGKADDQREQRDELRRARERFATEQATADLEQWQKRHDNEDPEVEEVLGFGEPLCHFFAWNSAESASTSSK